MEHKPPANIRPSDPGTISQCTCGRLLPLARELLDQRGKLLVCPSCGYKQRVWQWVASANREGASPHG